MQYVQLTKDFVAQVIEVFCQKKKMEVNKKDINKVYSSLVDDDTVEKAFFCGVECAKSKLPCMKKVECDEMFCYVHDPARKCQGTTIKGANCRSVAKTGETHCKHHRDQDRGRMKSSDNKASVDKRAKSPKNLKKTHTSKFASSDDDMASEDDEPKKRKKNKNKQESSDDEASDDDGEESSDDDGEEDRIAVSFPLSSKVVDITSKKNVPLAETGIWARYETNPAFLYAKSFTVNGKYIIKTKEKDLYIVLCPPKLIGKNLPVPEISKKEANILEKMGLQRATAADVEKVEEYSADDTSDDDDSDDSSSDENSDDDSSDEDASDDEKSNKKPDVESDDDTSKDKSNRKSSHEKPSKGDDDKSSRKKRHSEKSKKTKESSDIDVPKDEKDEHTFALAATVHNITSAEGVPLAKDGGWVVHPNNDMLEYATNFTMKGKYIVKLCGNNKYVGLFTLKQLRGGGKASEMDILERSMLSKMKLQQLSDEERKILYNEEVEVEEELPVEGPTDISKMKWEKLNKYLEYSKNLLVNGKHILKFRKQNIVVGLMTADHIFADNVEYDILSLREKEKLFAMGFYPQEYKPSMPKKDKPVEKVDDEKQESNVKETPDDGVPMESKNVNGSSVDSTKDNGDFIKAMGEVYSKIAAIEEELREEYASTEGSAEEKELISHLDLLEKEYSNYETWHKDKFGIREPDQDMLYKFAKEGSTNRRTIVQSVLDSIQAKEQCKGDLSSTVTVETAEE